MIVPLRLGDADPASRLSLIAETTATCKRQPLHQPNTRLLQRWMVRVMKRQHLVNLIVSNVPGPCVPLYIAGVRVAGRLNLDVVGDPDALPDLAVFTDGVADTLSRLGALAGTQPSQAAARHMPGSTRGPQ